MLASAATTAAPSVRAAWRSFVRGMRGSLTAPAADTIVHAVVGNEASDVDSIVSALVLAFSLSRSENPQALRLAIQAKYPHHKHVFVPLVNLSPDKEEGCRPELHLRLDALHILGHLDVDPTDLVYARGCGSLSSSKALRNLHSNGQLRMILVDHNAYKAHSGEQFGDVVEAIVDHHKDFEQHTQSVLPGFRNVQMVGSACSLVAQSMEEAGQLELLQADDGFLSWALASVILLDTNALDSDRSAFVALDEVQCRTLSLFAGIDMVEHYGELLRLRSCMDGFGIKDMLRKDYKQWSAVESSQQSCIEEKDNAESFKTLQYGLSSIISSYESCQDISENGTAHLDAMRSFAADLRLEVLGIMFLVVEESGVHRQLLLHVPEHVEASGRIPGGLRNVVAGISSRLDLEPLNLFESRSTDNTVEGGEPTKLGATSAPFDFALFRQVNPKLSRKKVQPVLHDALTEILTRTQ